MSSERDSAETLGHLPHEATGKLKHWRGLWRHFGLEAAPVLEFACSRQPQLGCRRNSLHNGGVINAVVA